MDDVVAHAGLPSPVSAMRAVERGYPTAVTGDVVSVDRITTVGTTVIDNNPATYDYPIAAGASIYCAAGGNPSTVSITLDQLRDEVAGRPVTNLLPIDQLYVYIQTDGHQATYVALRPRSQIS